MKRADLHTWVDNFYKDDEGLRPDNITTIDEALSYAIDSLIEIDSEITVMGKGFDYLRPDLEDDLKALLIFLDHIYRKYDNCYLNFMGVI